MRFEASSQIFSVNFRINKFTYCFDCVGMNIALKLKCFEIALGLFLSTILLELLVCSRLLLKSVITRHILFSSIIELLSVVLIVLLVVSWLLSRLLLTRWQPSLLIVPNGMLLGLTLSSSHLLLN